MSEARPTPAADETGELRVYTTPSTTATGQHQAVKVASGNPTQRWWSILVLLVAAAVSFFAVGQLRGPDRFRDQLQTESEGDLTRILASLSSESAALRDELTNLKIELSEVRNSSQAEGAATEQAKEQLEALQVLAGTVPVTGAGIEMTILDPDNQVTFDALVDAVQELRDAGAEALAVNGRRIGVTSAFGQRGQDITLDGVILPRPFILVAIGPAPTMEGGLKIPGGSLDTLAARRNVQVDVHRTSSIDMPALETPPTFQTARPVPSK